MDFEEIVRSSVYNVTFFEGFNIDILAFNHFERFIIDTTDERNNFQEENKTLLQTLTKKFLFQYMVVV